MKTSNDAYSFGNSNIFKLLYETSTSRYWTESTRAMHIKGVGCLVKVTIQQDDNVSGVLQFVPGVKIVEDIENDKVVGRHLEAYSPEDLKAVISSMMPGDMHEF
jgi:hypothetical protein